MVSSQERGKTKQAVVYGTGNQPLATTSRMGYVYWRDRSTCRPVHRIVALLGLFFCAVMPILRMASHEEPAISGGIHRRLLFWSNHPHQHPSRTNEEHLTEHSLEHDGLTRTFLQHLPENYQAGNPMLIVLHGGEGTQSSNFHSGGLRPGSFAGRPWARLSNQYGFLLLSPGAVPVNGGLFGVLNGAWWNDGR